MIKLTEELRKKIEESGIPIIDITIDQLSSATIINLKDTTDKLDL
jgi:hypothetical protein